MTAAPNTRGLVLARPEPQAVELTDRTLPPPGARDALLRITCAGICGTDLHIIGWNRWAASRYRTPLPLGHELCGEVLQVPPGLGFAPGDRVSAETHLACGVCPQCRCGRGHTCQTLQTFTGLGLGAFATKAVVPVALLRHAPPQVPDEQVAAMEPAGIGLRAARRALSHGDAMIVSGCGPIGLLAILALRHHGASRIVAVEPSEARRTFALACGAHDAFATAAEAAAPSGALPDAVIETSGVPAALSAALAMPRAGGSVVTVGLPSADVPLDIARHIVLREIRLEGLYGRLLDEGWADLRDAFGNGFDLAPAITHSFPLEAFKDAMGTAQQASSGKVILRM